MDENTRLRLEYDALSHECKKIRLELDMAMELLMVHNRNLKQMTDDVLPMWKEWSDSKKKVDDSVECVLYA